MAVPTVEDVLQYLGFDEAGYSQEQVESAYAAEKAAQAAACSVPADGEDWPADLSEALCRRVAHNLAVRENPLGVKSFESEFGLTTARVGALDAEVRRLEAPYVRLVVS